MLTILYKPLHFLTFSDVRYERPSAPTCAMLFIFVMGCGDSPFSFLKHLHHMLQNKIVGVSGTHVKLLKARGKL